MWVVIAGVGGFIATVLLRVVDVLVEGRGAWARRSIRADIELLEALPKDLRDSDGAGALRLRIDQELAAFGALRAAPPSENGGVDDADVAAWWRARFEREVKVVERRVLVGVGLALVVGGMAWTITDADVGTTITPLKVALSAVVGIAGGMLLSTVIVGVAHWSAVQVVERRWHRAGQPLPALP